MLANGPRGGWLYGCTARCCGTVGPVVTLVPESGCCVGCADGKPAPFKDCKSRKNQSCTQKL